MPLLLEDRSVNGRRALSLMENEIPTANRCAAEAVQRAMRSSAYRSLSRIGVSTSQGRVVLAGRVSSYYLKQLAQTLAMRVCGRVEVKNEVQVC
jgi:osmotically-inducible protein OsmY